MSEKHEGRDFGGRHEFDWSRLLPFLRWRGLITARSTRADLLAGITGAIIVLPQGVAFALIAGCLPSTGCIRAIVPAMVAALFGSSHHLISGPTTAISIVVFTTVAPLADPGGVDYIRLVLTLTFMAGAFQLALGLARLGAMVNFISHSVVVGFTAGAALLIGMSQMSTFLGIPGDEASTRSSTSGRTSSGTLPKSTPRCSRSRRSRWSPRCSSRSSCRDCRGCCWR